MERSIVEPSTVLREASGPLVPPTMETTLVGDDALIVVAGDLDLNTSHGLMHATHAVVDRGATRLTFDLAGVGFIDSSGIRALLVASAIANVTLRNPSEQVLRLIDLKGLAGDFTTE